MEPLLEVKNLTKVFKKKGQETLSAVDHLNFCLYPGETLGIVGESGSGKSTVARAVTRLLPVTEGKIYLEGREITGLKGRKLADIYRGIQMVFQSPAGSFDPRRTLGDGIGESLKNSGMGKAERKQRVAELLRRCGLPEEYGRRYPHEVSGGECQRAAIARALAIRPKLLICDEATSALDVTVQKQILELLAEIKKEEGMAYLFICHDLALVQQFCDRVLVMENGKIVEEGPAGEVILRPKAAYTRRLLESVL
ncbi:MAG TPA: ABC transporter ATP-binding protein [Candidatus Scatomonas pullistercoris]|uniref:ABC transporter ATP-binding protein n=1 Tax=Candidatus Scatomonas pullistercoris TaxID=2840920 RepID=A0A9D1P214_9FIRM|nr:ABC transporter ATP-binding protein [Candidatus Scatomonas pullistercoris]